MFTEDHQKVPHVRNGPVQVWLWLEAVNSRGANSHHFEKKRTWGVLQLHSVWVRDEGGAFVGDDFEILGSWRLNNLMILKFALPAVIAEPGPSSLRLTPVFPSLQVEGDSTPSILGVFISSLSEEGGALRGRSCGKAYFWLALWYQRVAWK